MKKQIEKHPPSPKASADAHRSFNEGGQKQAPMPKGIGAPTKSVGEENQKLQTIKQMVEAAEASVKTAKNLLLELLGETKPDYLKKSALFKSQDGKIVEGIFDGQNMIDKNGKKYPVPANYASKSKLVSGDILKLTIAPDGTFVYKQIKPIPRKTTVGVLTEVDEKYKVVANNKAYNVLPASITYFKGKPGDKVTITLPKSEPSEWAAVENVIGK